MHAWHMRCAKGWQLGQHFRAHVRLHCCMQCSGGGAAEGTLLPAAARTFLAELVQGRPEHSVKQREGAGFSKQGARVAITAASHVGRTACARWQHGHVMPGAAGAGTQQTPGPLPCADGSASGA